MNGRQRAARRYRGGIAYARSPVVPGRGPGAGAALRGLGAYAGVLDEVAVYGRRWARVR